MKQEEKKEQIEVSEFSPNLYVHKITKMKYILIRRGLSSNVYLEMGDLTKKKVHHSYIDSEFYYYGGKVYDEDLIRAFSLLEEKYILTEASKENFEKIMMRFSEKYIGPNDFRKVEPIYIDAENAGKIYETTDGNTLYCQINMDQAVKMGKWSEIINLPEAIYLDDLQSHMFNLDEVFKVIHRYKYEAGINQLLKNKERELKEKRIDEKKKIDVVIENGILSKKNNIVNFRNISRLNYTQPGVGMKECIFFYDGKDEIFNYVASREEYDKVVLEYKNFFKPKPTIY